MWQVANSSPRGSGWRPPRDKRGTDSLAMPGTLLCMEPGGASNELPEKAEVQLRKGVLEYCVLALLRDGPKYGGVELLDHLQATGTLATSQGTVYPLLSRLRRDDLVVTTWRESPLRPSPGATTH